ncbi:fimbrial adhesion protein [Buttiauxella ferragutiae ATCC 51602]|uniref:Fimbrial adhesion protein n=1 Tax=Buttiauxella ferragutiae ATCC 51602 TaxID=1354252 RepID=A0ABX2WEE4_9ENTR|nr:fimbrial protein [Buttiauxella ferragutiae]OAT33513.1 fimbrial adhesion protein [Buttiauxella ferragutiae ATCC 51602]
MSIKIGALSLFLLVNIFVVSAAVSSQPQGWGKVNMVGAIIETACAIDTENRDQTINMGTLPISQIARDGQSLTKQFSIRLVNCVLTRQNASLPDWRHFKVAFDGHHDSGLFGVEGDAKGVALQLIDSQGNIITPGSPLSLEEITSKEMLLKYSLRLVSNNQLLRAGQFTSTVKFKMDYY